MGRQEADFLGNGVLWKSDRGLLVEYPEEELYIYPMF